MGEDQRQTEPVRLHRTSFADFILQVCTKIIILFYLFDVV